jgi:H+-transporting ATPase
MLTYTLNKIIKTLFTALLLTVGVLFTHELILTPLLMILLILVNDFVTMTISTDNVSFSNVPERWNVRSLILTSIPLAGLSLVFGLIILFVGRAVFHLSPPVVQTLVFIILAFNGQGMTYLVRERTHLWRSRPSAWLFVSTILAVLVVSVFAICGILMTALAPALVIGILFITMLYLLGIDFLKIRIFRYFGMRGKAASK